MPVQAPSVPMISPPGRGSRGAGSNKLLEEGFNEGRVALLKRKRANILKGANAADPKIQERISRIDARIDEIKGISPADRAKTTRAQAEAVEAAEDVQRARDKEVRDKAAAERKAKLDQAALDLRSAQHDRQLALTEKTLGDIEKNNIEIGDLEAARKLRDKAASEGLDAWDIASSPMFMIGAPTLHKDALDTVRVMANIDKIANQRKVPPDKAVEMKIAVADYALASLEEMNSDLTKIESMAPPERFQAMKMRLERMNEVDDPQLRQVFQTFLGILREVDRGGPSGEGDEALSDEEMADFADRLGAEAEMFMNVRASLDKARGKGGAADIFGLGGGGDDEYKPSIMNRRKPAAAAPDKPAGGKSEQKSYLDDLMSRYTE